jgi:hypothetical protein
MCEKCEELDRRIERYRRIASLMTDRLALSSIALLIERYEAQKRELHPKRREETAPGVLIHLPFPRQ